MAGETVITVIGNLTADPEMRFTPAGAAVANFTIASTPRTFDRQTNEWKDGDTLFMRCSVWRETAENVAETLTKGMRVIAQGRLAQRAYETKEGEKRQVTELEVDEIGPSLKHATAKVTRTQRNGNGQQQGGQQQQQQGQPPAQQQQQGGGWLPPGQQAGGWTPPGPGQQQAGNGGGWNAPAADPWGNQGQQR